MNALSSYSYEDLKRRSLWQMRLLTNYYVQALLGRWALKVSLIIFHLCHASCFCSCSGSSQLFPCIYSGPTVHFLASSPITVAGVFCLQGHDDKGPFLAPRRQFVCCCWPFILQGSLWGRNSLTLQTILSRSSQLKNNVPRIIERVRWHGHQSEVLALCTSPLSMNSRIMMTATPKLHYIALRGVIPRNL